LAEELGRRIDAETQLELVAPVSFGLVSFRHRGGDQSTDALVKAINESGEAYVTPSRIDDRRFIRVSVGQTMTARPNVERLSEIIEEALAKEAKA
jgi:aromatic-L-amino-acid/L-tryptophan decarboxylase